MFSINGGQIMVLDDDIKFPSHHEAQDVITKATQHIFYGAIILFLSINILRWVLVIGGWIMMKVFHSISKIAKGIKNKIQTIIKKTTSKDDVNVDSVKFNCKNEETKKVNQDRDTQNEQRATLEGSAELTNDATKEYTSQSECVVLLVVNDDVEVETKEEKSISLRRIINKVRSIPLKKILQRLFWGVLKVLEVLSMIVIIGMITMYILLLSSLEIQDFEVVALMLTLIWYSALIFYFLPSHFLFGRSDNYKSVDEEEEGLEENAENELTAMTSSSIKLQKSKFEKLNSMMRKLREFVRRSAFELVRRLTSKQFWIISFILILSLGVIALFLSFAVSSLCLSTHPNEISTRFTRLFNNNYYDDNGDNEICSSETGICHVYLVAPEDPMHSMNILFHSNRNPINARIMIGTSPDDLNSRIKFGTTKKMENIKDEDRYVTQIYLDNLDDSTLYYFQIQFDDSFSRLAQKNGSDHQSEIMKFKTFSSSSSTPISFIAGGDFGLSESTYSMSEYAKTLNPQFIAIGGDIAYENGYSACYHRYDQVLSILQNTLISPVDQTLIPIILTIGNHEVDGDFKSHKVSKVEQVPFFLDYFPHYSPEAAEKLSSPSEKAYHYHIIGDKTLLINLDSNHINKIVDQVPWLIDTLERFKGFEFFVQYHAPAYPIHGKYSNTKAVLIRENWIPIFDLYNVTLVFENHGHCYKRTHLLRNQEKVKTDGTLFLGDGSWGAQPQRSKNHKEWYIHTSHSINNLLKIEVNFEKNATHFQSHTDVGKIIDSGFLPFRNYQSTMIDSNLEMHE